MPVDYFFVRRKKIMNILEQLEEMMNQIISVLFRVEL